MDNISLAWQGGNENSVHSYHDAGQLVIEVAGNVLLSGLDALEDAFLIGVAEVAGLVTLDLTRVNLLDAAGLSLLVRHSKRLRTPDGPCGFRVLVRAGGQPDRVLMLGNFGMILEVLQVP